VEDDVSNEYRKEDPHRQGDDEANAGIQEDAAYEQSQGNSDDHNHLHDPVILSSHGIGL